MSAEQPNLRRLRRIALKQQGLIGKNPFGRGLPGAVKALNHIGYVQIDTISVVERAHHHTLATRVPSYQPAMFNRLLSSGHAFEYWFHAASVLPMAHYRFSLAQMEQFKAGERWRSVDKRVLKNVLARIENEGPLRARDFDEANHRGGGWWQWKPAKRALEHLFLSGELMMASREGFEKRFDLRDRVLPSSVDTTAPSVDERAAHLIELNLKAHGLVTPKTITYLRGSKALRDSVNAQLRADLEGGQLIAQQLDNGEPYFIDVALNESRLPPCAMEVKILSPFDNAVIHRHRLQHLFGVDYRIECYVPKPKRQFGYFCLPLLYGDRIVGRIDCKAHRHNKVGEPGHLEVISKHMERDVDDAFEPAFSVALHEFARFNGCQYH